MDCYVDVLGTLASNRYLTYVGCRAWVLLYSERCASKRHAMSREWHLKRDRAFRKDLAQALKK